MLSRSDLIKDRTALEEAAAELRRMNPTAFILDHDYHNAAPFFWDRVFEDKAPHFKAYGTDEELPPEDKFDEISIAEPYLDTVGELVFFFEELLRGRFGCVIRGKGTVLIGNEAVRADISNGRYVIEGAQKRTAGFVLIGSYEAQALLFPWHSFIRWLCLFPYVP